MNSCQNTEKWGLIEKESLFLINNLHNYKDCSALIIDIIKIPVYFYKMIDPRTKEKDGVTYYFNTFVAVGSSAEEIPGHIVVHKIPGKGRDGKTLVTVTHDHSILEKNTKDSRGRWIIYSARGYGTQWDPPEYAPGNQKPLLPEHIV